MAKGKNVLTTGDVAKICHVAPRTVSKWFDKGQLKGYRIPGSKDRRIPIAELIRFMRAHHVPIPDDIEIPDNLGMGKIKLLLVDDPESPLDASESGILSLKQNLERNGNLEVKVAEDGVSTGILIVTFLPDVILLNLSASIIGTEIIKAIRESDDIEKDIKVIAIVETLDEQLRARLIEQGYAGCTISDMNAIMDEINGLFHVGPQVILA